MDCRRADKRLSDIRTRSQKRHGMDQFDRRILALVQRNCQLKTETIAEEIGLSASAVQRRLRALRANGTIAAEVAVVQPRAGMTFIAGLEIARDSYEALDRLRHWAEGHDNIQQLYYVTGGVDLIAVVLARDAEDYDAITAAMMRDNPMIERITTNVVLRPMKVGLYRPIDET